MVTLNLAESYENSANLHDYSLFVFVQGTFALYQFALFLSYLFVVSIVNPFFPPAIKGEIIRCF